MKIYNYDPISKIYSGESEADPDPLQEGNWLIPAYATTLTPPRAVEGKVAFWTGGSWTLREIPAPEPDPDVGPPATPSDLRAAAYRAEADPLYFMAQRGEATMEAWLNKIAEIKARYPN